MTRESEWQFTTALILPVYEIFTFLGFMNDEVRQLRWELLNARRLPARLLAEEAAIVSVRAESPTCLRLKVTRL